VVDEAVDVGGQRRELRGEGVERERGIRDTPAEVGILVVGRTGLEGLSALDRLDGKFERAVGDPCVDGADEQQEVREDAEDEGVGAGADGQDARHPGCGNDRALEHRRVTLGRAHAQGVPVVERRPSRRLARDEAVHQFVAVTTEDAEPGPRGGERGEDLGAREGVTRFDRLSERGRVPQHEVVALLAVAEGEELASRGIVEHPVEGGVAAIVEHPCDSHPHEVHVDRERGRGGVGGQEPLVAGRLDEAARSEVSDRLQFVEVFGEERVIAVVAGGARPDALEQLLPEHQKPAKAHAATTTTRSATTMFGLMSFMRLTATLMRASNPMATHSAMIMNAA